MAKRSAAVPDKPSLPIVAQPVRGKAEVAVDPPIRVRILANGKVGTIVTAERSGPLAIKNEVEDRPLASVSRDQTMYVVAIGGSQATLRADQVEVL